MEERKTPLYQSHVLAGGKMIPFAGYLMPVQYKTGVIAEHMAVRKAAGLFDVSHMGEIWMEGKGAINSLQHLLTNNMQGMQDGDCRYSPMCNQNGGTVDDLLVYRFSAEKYLLVVNASNKDKDFAWIQNNLKPETTVKDDSDNLAEIALQGPAALNILASLTNQEMMPQKYYTFVPQITVAGIPCIVSRTGYTGEDGFELYCAADKGAELWDALLQKGEPQGLIPCGLGARDTLRLEAGMPLYGHEMDDEITPRQAGLGFFVKMDKEDFIGKAALEQAGTPSVRRTGLRLTGKGIARDGDSVLLNGQPIGRVTSGTMLTYAGYAGAMALINQDHRAEGTQVQIDVRGRLIDAEVVKLPFYKRQK
ncbi:MAG: glycine cleavage system aminomethyltransferase GcvT [Oscillospiraceae bacterium]